MIQKTDRLESGTRDRLLVAVDVDGTLLNTEFEDVLRDREVAAVAAVREAGHLVVLSTGRNWKSLQRLLDQLSDRWGPPPLVLLNGAVVMGGSPLRRLCHHVLDRPVQHRLVELFRVHGAVPMIYDVDDRGGRLLYEDRPVNTILSRYLAKRRSAVGALLAVTDLLDHLPETALEVGTIDRHEVVAALTAQIRQELSGVVKVVNTLSLVVRRQYSWAEVYHRASGKGQGALVLAAEYNIPARNIVAVGDNYNDLDLFAAAGWSVAMGNAPGDVQAEADRIAPPVSENGAAVILEEIAAGRYPPPAR